MKTRAINKERAVLDSLVRSWNSDVRPLVIPAACVLSARITAEVLKHFDIKHEVIPMRLMVANDLMLEHLFQGDEPDKWNPEAWSVGVGFSNMVAVNRDNRSAEGFDGHVIVRTANFHVDLTAYQFDRPEHGIVSGGSLVVPQEELVMTGPFNPENPWSYIKLPEGHMMFQENGNWNFMKAPDWSVNYKRQLGSIITTIKSELS